eukprot:TRINITY_DN65682_c0_g1_i1.p1 TRINITY_DN65682_c0_g1~~TRINITY_DN65682_c0_g1_i1.p1  ORF type:complete len:227 (+),score=32.88 TRINITY_DN65682_c0_g1_i1:187-867(+)
MRGGGSSSRAPVARDRGQQERRRSRSRPKRQYPDRHAAEAAGRAASCHEIGGPDEDKAALDALCSACDPVSREFAKRAGALLKDHIAKVSAEIRRRYGGRAELEKKVFQEASAVLALEDSRGKRLSQLRTRVDELHRRLRALSLANGGASFAAPLQALGIGTAALPGLQGRALTSMGSGASIASTSVAPTRGISATPTARRSSSAPPWMVVPPWAAPRRTERPRLL